jgi:hypothetical protein
MMFRRDDRGADPRWEVAAATQVFSAPRETVMTLVREVDAKASERGLDGVLIARPHPTGWFLHAVRRDDLRGEDLDHFNELVTVRTYLLLRHGPVPPMWSPVYADHEWRSAALSTAAELAAMVGDLED